MAADGTKHITIGALLLLGGGGLTLLGLYAARPGSQYVIFGGAMVVGVAELLFGISQYATYKSKPRPANPFADAPLHVNLLFRAMVAAAKLGGRLDERMVENMRAIMSDVCGKDFDAPMIIDGCKALWDDDEPITSYLFDNFSKLPLEFRRIIIRASNVVLSSGQAGSDQQRDFLLFASRALQLSDDEFGKNTGMTVRD